MTNGAGRGHCGIVRGRPLGPVATLVDGAADDGDAGSARQQRLQLHRRVSLVLGDHCQVVVSHCPVPDIAASGAPRVLSPAGPSALTGNPQVDEHGTWVEQAGSMINDTGLRVGPSKPATRDLCSAWVAVALLPVALWP